MSASSGVVEYRGAEEAAQEVFQLDDKPAPAAGASRVGLAADAVDGIAIILHA